MAIVVCGLSHKTVPLPVLEQVAVPPHALEKALAQLLDHDPIHEAVILSTCNRTEVYATVHRFHPAVQAVRRFLSDVSGVAQDRVADGLYTYYDASAVEHLFNVASGTDSMVVGESEILGQVKEAYRVAADQGTARRMLAALFQRALRVGKRVRTETAIARHVVSLPQAAAREAERLAGGLGNVVVVGAGRMGELAARAASERGCGSVVIANRTPERARALVERLATEGRTDRAIGLEELPDALREADVVITVTAAVEPILDARSLAAVTAQRDRVLVAIDLGVPRDIDPSVRELEGVELRDIDDLGAVVDHGAAQRRAELPKVERIVAEEVDAFCAWERALALGPSIVELRSWAEGVRSREMAKHAHKLDDAGRAALEQLSRSIVNKMLHRPVTQMKELVRGQDGQVYLEAFQEIFDIDAE